ALRVPAYWRERKNDCSAAARVHRLLELADVLSPWNVGRYQSPAAAERWAETMVKPDLEWCKAHGKELMPVVFPGSSWFNLTRPWKQHSPFDDVLDPISRRKGAFLRAQYVAFVRAGVKMVFQAMFDEMDEGTRIMKCTNDPPIGPSPFATYEGLPSDHYLKLVGQATRLVRGEIKTLPPAT